MAGEKRRQRTYALLGMPDPATVSVPSASAPPWTERGIRELEQGWIEVGSFRAGDDPDLVEALAERRLKGIGMLLDLPGLYPEVRSYLHQCQFHSYQDFLLSLRHARPTRREGVQYGTSLDRHRADMAGYLDYLQEKAPGLARFLSEPLPFAVQNENNQISVLQTIQHSSRIVRILGQIDER